MNHTKVTKKKLTKKQWQLLRSLNDGNYMKSPNAKKAGEKQ